MKVFTCIALSLLMLLSLCSCGFLPETDSPMQEQNTTIMKTDFDIRGFIYGDSVPCYAERSDETPIRYLSTGDQVHIHYREIANNESWVFTDMGWIYGDYVLSVGDGAIAIVISDTLFAFAEPSYESVRREWLTMGQYFKVQALGFVEDMVWVKTEAGYLPLQGVLLSGSAEPGTLEVTAKSECCLFYAPGLQSISDQFLSPGQYTLIQFQEEGNLVWGQMQDGMWLCLDFVSLPYDVEIFTSTGTFRPDPDTDYPVPPETLPVNPGGVVTPVNPGGNEKPGDEIVQTPNDTDLVGKWVCFDPQAFLNECYIGSEQWIFNADGSFQSGGSEIMYFEDMGGWYGASGGWYYDGVFTYDGTTLVTQYTLYDADPSIEPETNTREFSCQVDGNIAQWNGSTYCRTEGDINTLIRECVRQNAASYVNADLPGQWNGDNGVTWSFNSDGTFTESGSGSGNGWYLYTNQQLILVYETRNGSSSSYIGAWYTVCSSDSMTCSSPYNQVTFTR